MLSVGITGGIGSGKTTVCRFFEFLKIPVYYADVRAKALMTEDPQVAAALRDAFGSAAFDPEGRLNRQALSDIVFNDAERLEQLNSIVHPAVWQDSSAWMQRHAGEDYILYEAAILFESGSYKMFDRTITIFAPEELRIKRVMERDDVSREAVLARMANQMEDGRKMELADYVIRNDGAHSLVNQVLQLHKELISLSRG